MAPSSRGLGHHPLKVKTRIRIPLGLPCEVPVQGRFSNRLFAFPAGRDPASIREAPAGRSSADAVFEIANKLSDLPVLCFQHLHTGFFIEF